MLLFLRPPGRRELCQCAIEFLAYPRTADGSGAPPKPTDQKVASPSETPPAQSAQYLLPRDLPGALTRLEDREVDALLVAVSREAERRGRLPPQSPATGKPADDDLHRGRSVRSRAIAAASSRQSLPDDGTPGLTLGRANAVRAAFRAGVKPSAIARQFGISLAALRRALASDPPGRNR